MRNLNYIWPFAGSLTIYRFRGLDHLDDHLQGAIFLFAMGFNMPHLILISPTTRGGGGVVL